MKNIYCNPKEKVFTMQALSCHLPEVQELQRQNHKDVVGVSEKGFLTCKFTIEELETFNQQVGIVVAIANYKVVGYNILLNMDETLKRPNYVPLIRRYQEIRKDVDLSKVALARQYCVSEEFRGGPVVQSLYQVQNILLRAKGFTTSIGEIDSRNRVSLLAARRLLGYNFIGHYESDDAVINWQIGERAEM